MTFPSKTEKSSETDKIIESFEDDDTLEVIETFHVYQTGDHQAEDHLAEDYQVEDLQAGSRLTEPDADSASDTVADLWAVAAFSKDDRRDGGIAAEATMTNGTRFGKEDVLPVLPKASEKFPFGAKSRPVRQKFDIKAWLKTYTADKTFILNVGPVLVFGLLLFAMFVVTVEKPFIMLLDGQPIAYVKKVEDGQRLLEQAGLELSAPYPAEANFRQDAEISYTREGVQIKTKPTDDQIILDSLKSGITWFIDAWTIAVSNEHTVYLPSKAQALEVLEDVKRSYLPEGEVTVIDTEFVEPVDLIMRQIPITDLGDASQAFRTLTEGREPLKEYKVQSGDSYWSIATKYNMTVDELMMLNEATDTKLRVGQILRLNIPKPLLSVKTTVSAIQMMDIPFSTVYRTNEDEWQGQSKVLSAGINGTKEVEYEIAKINGFMVERKVLAETVIADPVDKVVESGSKVIVASRSETVIAPESRQGSSGGGSGVLVWPIRARINSPFGYRSRGYHSGLDLQAETGDPIYSAGAGKVISSGFFADYGNQVTIDHGDGLSTMYAHLSQINVAVGQEVGVQELVGLAGTTGRTTGPHLHFEVRINGTAVNPVDYLN
ncbi:MAG: peptidoglycan DD-metalloendopeptidase family protein [Peptococcaceae bacterium]|jgi:murein DD-endopeptidase MepM/ murein hydrolase activator NlpD|nr:peptidoglycan DD-metalloendopeptidase family protein [Peptococcaceae bacterium]